MSFSEEKKNQIKHYLLEKIRDGQSSVVKRTAEAFGVTPASVYKYLDAMEAAGILEKIKHGEYRLLSDMHEAVLRRDKDELKSEGEIYNQYLLPYLRALPGNVRQIWEYVCSEMINNVIDHSEAETLEIVLMQNALKTTVRLTDNGVGIFEKIRAHFGLATAEEAVGELFKGKVTTDEARHSGKGIFFSSRMVDTFVILSGGLVFTHNRFEGDAPLANAAQPAKGTAVCMTLANDSQKQAKDVFDRYADVDGGFTKTRIPLNHFFESAPVSRSQAKRLLSRLEQFREVELDFEGLDWMGQGFAHELFVVYPNAHPDVRLIPLNMNDDVKKMYTHVTTP